MPNEKFNDTAGFGHLEVSWGKWAETVEIGWVLNKGTLTQHVDSWRKAAEAENVEDYNGLWLSLSEEDLIRLAKVVNKARRQSISH